MLSMLALLKANDQTQEANRERERIRRKHY